MDEILKMLGIDKLDESKQDEIKTKLSDIVDVKAKEIVEEKEKEFKETLTEHYSEKFENYKQEISEKFSNFVDSVLDEEMQIPERVMEYARKGELYDELIESFKAKLAIDEGYLDEEAKNLLRECKDEISKSREEINTLMKENMQVKQDAKEFAANLYIREKCEGLDLKKQEKIISLLEGITDQKVIDRKFDVILESIGETKQDDEINEDEVNGKGKDVTIINENENDVETDPFTKMKSFWLSQLNEQK